MEDQIAMILLRRNHSIKIYTVDMRYIRDFHNPLLFQGDAYRDSLESEETYHWKIYLTNSTRVSIILNDTRVVY